MNLVKRAGLYTVRHKLKSGILFLVLLVISTFILIGIATLHAVNQAATNVRTNLGGEITLSDGGATGHLGIDEMASHILDGSINDFTSENGNPNRLRRETLNAILEIPGIVDYNMTLRDSFMGTPKNFSFISTGFGFNLGLENSEDIFTVYSVSNSERMEGFANGNLRLESGRHLTNDDYRAVLISEELAELNGIKLGDILELSGSSTGGHFFVTMIDNVSAQPRISMTFEVVGIFSGTRGSSGFMQGLLPSNQLITDLASSIHDENPDILPSFLSVFVDDPLEIDNIFYEISNLPEVYGRNFIMTMGIEGFEAISTPLESLQGVVFIMIVIIIAVSLAILAILLTIWIRERVKEIGIFLSVGIKKVEIVGQFMLEALLIAVFAFAISLPASQLVAEGAGGFMMTQFQNVQDTQGEVEGQSSEIGASVIRTDGLRGAAPTFEGTLENIDISISGRNMLWVYVIGISVVSGSVWIASYSVAKLKPKEILSKMS